ncbi:cytochrome bc complex cytochrome b subunit [Nocardioides sp. CFH 31398]|uniref:cytochrome bc1 complex cytochrome b subunit n=1 Tax=Nocardioides sp. CFH 31398 TaxID=2919579 RepID=UPI001F0687F5|nr:cytochrome bc complex cytochrome b subunit [Nocardioides sp. CFH 31398]MCH1868204.1 cytochrome bc complex cytochrome b subunit [Nocardioides sp. CFH 31398]
MSTTETNGAGQSSVASQVASTNGAKASSAKKGSPVGKAANWADERLGLAGAAKKNLRKVFPDHWSFMLGEIALWSFVVLLITGVFLTLWYRPSMAEVTYTGAYEPMRGLHVSEAFASTVDLSFDVRGGLLMRQMHHWAAMLFIAAMLVHMMRVYFTGAYRKPRELNWVIGVLLLVMGTLEGFTGYSLPDDMLSGTGIRAADGFVKSIPVIGTYASFFLFDGEFPGSAVISRLYTVHVLLLPGLILGLIAAHMLLLVYHKHTQWPGPGRTEQNVVGYPMLPVYAAKAGGFFFIVFGVTALLGGLFTLNPIWAYGPYDPSKVTAGSQPDWYMGWPDGALRIFPGPPLEYSFFGVTLSLNVFIPIILLPTIAILILLALPFVEAWITKDKREHHLLERPRDAPGRTATMVALMTFYGLMWMAGGNDIIAITFDLSINQITYFLRVAVIVGPILAFIITRRWCISLQRKDKEDLLHGYETGIIMRSAQGGFSERHEPLPVGKAYAIAQRDPDRPVELERATDENGVPSPTTRSARLRHRLSAYLHGGGVDTPTRAELEKAHAHAAHEHELEGSGDDRALTARGENTPH